MAGPVCKSPFPQGVRHLACEQYGPAALHVIEATTKVPLTARVSRADRGGTQTVAAKAIPAYAAVANKQSSSKDDAAQKPALDDLIPDWARTGCSSRSNNMAYRVASLTRGRVERPEVARRNVSASISTLLLTVRQSAEQLNVSSKTIRRLIARGELTAVRIGRSVRIRPEELVRLIFDGHDN